MEGPAVLDLNCSPISVDNGGGASSTRSELFSEDLSITMEGPAVLDLNCSPISVDNGGGASSTRSELFSEYLSITEEGPVLLDLNSSPSLCRERRRGQPAVAAFAACTVCWV